MRPKTRRRLVILAAAVAVSAGGVTGLYQYRQHQIHGKLMGFRTAGMEASARGDFDEALKDLSNYVGKPLAQRDAEALLTYGQARVKVSEADGRNVVEGIGVYRRYLDLRPDDRAAKHELLRLYTTAGYASEAIKLSGDLLGHDGNDADARLAMASALAAQGKYDAALPHAERYVAMRPTDLAGHVTLFQVLAKKGAPAAEVVTRYEGLKAAHAGDPRFDLLLGIAQRYANDTSAALASFRAAAAASGAASGAAKAGAGPAGSPQAGQVGQDAQFVSMLSQQFDAMGVPEEADAVIERSAARSQDPQVMLVLVRRLWQTGKYGALIERLKDVNPGTRTSDTQLVGFRALCLLETGRAAEARPYLDGLADRKNDPAAVAWSMALHAGYVDELAARAAVDQLRAAVVRDPGNVVIEYLLARAYERLGENGLALRAYRDVVDPSRAGALPMWATPYERMARVYMDTARPQQAWRAAAEGYKRSPVRDVKNPATREALVTLAEALAQVARTDRSKVAPLGQTLRQIQGAYPNEPRTLPIFVAMLAQTAEVKEGGATRPGREVAKELVARYLASKPGDVDSTLALAAVCRSRGLGMEEQVLAAAERAAGGATPAVVGARAEALAAAGKPADGLALIEAAAAKAPAGAAVGWRVAEAQFRERTRDPRAAADWRTLATDYPDSLAAQSATLGALSAWSDRDLMREVIDRVHGLTGDEGMTWRVARARWLLSDPKADDRSANEAVVLLTDVVRVSPDLVAPRLMLARALRSVNNVLGGIEQLTRAAALDPNSPDIVLDLVDMLQQQGRLDEARQAARRAAENPALSPRYRTLFATRLAGLGDQATAMRVLSAVQRGGDATAAAGTAAAADAPDAGAEREAALAELNWRQGKFGEAERIYRELLARPNLDAESAAAAADFFAARGDAAAAEKALSAVLARPLAPGVADLIRARYEERGGDAKAAAGHYAAAVKAAPERPEAWGQLVAFDLRQDRWDDAVAAADDAAKAVPQDAAVKAMAANVRAMSALPVRSQMRAMADAVTRTPTDPALAETLGVLGRSNGEVADAAVAAALDGVVGRYPRFLPAYELLIAARTGLGQRGEVAAAAERVLATFPNDARAAEVATLAYMGVGRWREGEAAGATWRGLTLDDPRPADMVMADAEVRQGDAAAAVARLRPHLAAAAAPGHAASKMLVVVAARAFIGSGQASAAADLLRPMAGKSPEWRATWLGLAGEFPDAVTAGAWVSQVKPLLDKDSTVEQFALGKALYEVAAHTGSDPTFAQAKAVLDPLAAKADAPDRVLYYAARVDERMQDWAGAEAMYRRTRAALAADAAGRPAASASVTAAAAARAEADVANNLAWVLLERPGADVTEARRLAEGAVRQSPTNADYQDTLARVYARLGQRDLAERTFRAALRIDPNKVETLVALGSMLSDAGQADKAWEVLDQIDQVPSASRSTLDKDGRERLRLLRERRKAATDRASAG